MRHQFSLRTNIDTSVRCRANTQHPDTQVLSLLGCSTRTRVLQRLKPQGFLSVRGSGGRWRGGSPQASSWVQAVMPITPQARRAPALPVFRLSSLPPLPRSSAFSWIWNKIQRWLAAYNYNIDMYRTPRPWCRTARPWYRTHPVQGTRPHRPRCKPDFFLTTMVRPMMDSGPLRVSILSVILISATPLSPAVTLPRSPTCLQNKTFRLMRTTWRRSTISLCTHLTFQMQRGGGVSCCSSVTRL